jgi:hypothetical protein
MNSRRRSRSMVRGKVSVDNTNEEVNGREVITEAEWRATSGGNSSWF